MYTVHIYVRNWRLTHSHPPTMIIFAINGNNKEQCRNLPSPIGMNGSERKRIDQHKKKQFFANKLKTFTEITFTFIRICI